MGKVLRLVRVMRILRVFKVILCYILVLSESQDLFNFGIFSLFAISMGCRACYLL